LDGVAFRSRRAKLAVVGESGCGKSTLARQVTMIERPTGGELKVNGVDVARADRATLKRLRPLVQMVFRILRFAQSAQEGRYAARRPLAINTELGADARRKAARDMLAKSVCGPSITGDIRTCSPAASDSASR
jgi:dipeptide transport system ATP-binding protein